MGGSTDSGCLPPRVVVKNVQSCYEELMCILLLIASKMASMRPDEVEELEGNVGRVLSRIELEREERRGGKTMRKSFYDTNNNPSLFTVQKNQPNLCKLIPFIPKHTHPRFCVFSLARYRVSYRRKLCKEPQNLEILSQKFPAVQYPSPA